MQYLFSCHSAHFSFDKCSLNCAGFPFDKWLYRPKKIINLWEDTRKVFKFLLAKLYTTSIIYEKKKSIIKYLTVFLKQDFYKQYWRVDVTCQLCPFSALGLAAYASKDGQTDSRASYSQRTLNYCLSNPQAPATEANPSAHTRATLMESVHQSAGPPRSKDRPDAATPRVLSVHYNTFDQWRVTGVIPSLNYSLAHHLGANINTILVLKWSVLNWVFLEWFCL